MTLNPTGKKASSMFFSIARKSIHFLSLGGSITLAPSDSGVMWPSMDALTDDGYDCQFGTNTLGHYFLTTLLLPTLLSTADHSPPGTVRVIHTSSMGHMHVPNIKWETLKDGPARRKLTNMQLYGQSKLVSFLHLFCGSLALTYALGEGTLLERIG
jgi:retinol dehydrogenase-12